MSLHHIVAVLGGDLYDGGCRANVPYPGHSRADRSLSLLLAGERVLVTCFGDGDWKAALDHLREQGLIDSENRPTDGGAAATRWPPAVVASNPEKIAAALDVEPEVRRNVVAPLDHLGDQWDAPIGSRQGPGRRR